jgi:hypothetical protein
MNKIFKIMNKDQDEINPYANPDGSPIDGKEPEFFAWAANKAKEKLNLLTPEEREKVQQAERDLNRRMQS